MKITGIVLALAAVSSFALAQPVTLPHQFQPGQPARASEVNTNLEVLRQSINRGFGIFFTTPVSALSGDVTTVVSASCPVDTIITGVACSCEGGGDRNFGLLFACDAVNNSGVVGCYLDTATYLPTRRPPRGRVTAQCLGAVSVEGRRMPVTPFMAAAQDPQLKGAQTKSPEALGAELVEAERRLRAAEEEQRRRLGR